MEEVVIEEIVNDVLIGEPLPEDDVFEDDSAGELLEYVSDGDSSVDNTVYIQMMEGIQLLADSSQQGYLSSSIVSVFDRLVDNGNYRYYVAYRANYEDSNSGFLYLSNNLNGTQLDECQVIHMYRVSTGNNYEYTYRYDVSYDDTEYFNLGNGGLYYTNIATGYPSLGSPVQQKQLMWFPVIAITIFLGALMIRRKIREC